MTLLVWLVASTTTVFSLVLALNDDASTQRFLGLLLVGVIVAVGCLKAWLILRFYLGLGPAAGGWRGIFIAFLIVIFVDVFAAQSAIILMTS
jgi:Mg2+/Co2+ transporter CorB